jgi:sulfur-oxidizing protein SoxX
MAAAAVTALVGGCASTNPQAMGYRVDDDGILAPLAGLSGNAERGRALVTARDPANCVLCHAVPGAAVAGDLAPSLAGVGARFSVAQLRLRVVDEQRVVTQTIMPSYYRVQGLNAVATEYRGRPILDAQAVEDVVTYLSTLR